MGAAVYYLWTHEQLHEDKGGKWDNIVPKARINLQTTLSNYQVNLRYLKYGSPVQIKKPNQRPCKLSESPLSQDFGLERADFK